MQNSRQLIAVMAGALVLAAVPGPALGEPPGGDDVRDRFTGQRSPVPRVPARPDGQAYRASGTDWDRSAAVERRVNTLLDQMTDAEKADLATGELNNNFGFYNNPIPRLGIPAQTMADGPVGVRVADPGVDKRTTQLPAGSALAATYDDRLAQRYGRLIGVEALHTGHNVSLAPSADIARTPLWGRAFEGFGEDPLLVGRLAGEVVRGIQASPVLATAKHPFAYNQETDRFNVDVQVAERALQEVYLRPFGILQRLGRPGSMMCSFNRLGGTYACENAALTTLLKDQLRFRGFVMSDYNATPSTVQAANAGLDQEQPGDQGPGSANFGQRLLDAVAAGQVSRARLTDMARRILRPMVGLGLFDRHPDNAGFATARHRALARRVAARGMVLLQNRRDALPLTGRARSIAVLGPDADNTSAQGGGSSAVTVPTASVSPLAGIRDRAGSRARVRYQPGTDGINEGDMLPGPAPLPASMLAPAAGSTAEGLQARYWSNLDRSGTPARSVVDPNVNVNFGFQTFPGFNVASPKIPTPVGQFALFGDLSAEWTGVMTAPGTGTIGLGLTARGDARLYVDGALVVEHTGALSSTSAPLDLVAGRTYDIRVEYAAPAKNSYQGGQIRLFWTHPDSMLAPKMAQAVRTADRARVAVVVVRDYETEGYDRPHLRLPKEQDLLIRTVAAVNPRTVVVVETGAATVVRPWRRQVEGIVQAWYPGQEQGRAIADVLWGDVNPSGHLPATVPRRESQVPGTPEGVASYTEGVNVGYRGYLATGERPEFPFGHGLSYTRFRYDDLRVRAAANGRGAVARFRVTNVGDRTGTAVPQVYVGRLPTPVTTPRRQLAGYDTVRLAPGRSRTVKVRIGRESVSSWDAAADAWVTPRGRVRVFVGKDVTATLSRPVRIG
ncbi:glycoside hydrolase family 3 C-terminal domain-containing protein [Nocardioides sp. W7]|uniref:beta-glucosidase H n=1 Tax=Nocardioides sp. W7 TaxID=2931390 RepID=UPI001FD2BD38|nr:glycoside hydrolase family 3 C-terminal domain-containing protein [Nocardioides sp. W7]